jgi:hypothetical protein
MAVGVAMHIPRLERGQFQTTGRPVGVGDQPPP